MGVLGINKDWMETKYLCIKIKKLCGFFLITIRFPIQCQVLYRHFKMLKHKSSIVPSSLVPSNYCNA